MKTNWEPFAPGDHKNYVPPTEWGKDHFSTLLYFEDCTVNQKGIVNNSRMRCHPRVHRTFAHLTTWDSKYDTVLANGNTIPFHDDWCCAEDLAAYGYLSLEFRVVDPEKIFNSCEVRVTLTPQGRELANDLRQWRADGEPVAKYKIKPRDPHIEIEAFNIAISRQQDSAGVYEYKAYFLSDLDEEGILAPDALTGSGENEVIATIQLLNELAIKLDLPF